MTWLIPSSLRSVFAPAPECSTTACMSGSNISDCDLAFWVTSSGTPSPRQFSWRGWQTRPWSRRLFGPETLRISNSSNGMTAWTSLWRASRASHGAQPATKPEPMMTAGSGPTSHSEFVRLNPGFAGSKMCGDLFQEADLSSSCLILPVSGSMRNGVLLRRPTLVPLMSANASSFWPTARANDSQGGAYQNQVGGGTQPTLVGAARMWGTPNTQKGGGKSRSGNRADELLLAGQAEKFWPKPASRDHKGENSADHLEAGTGRLHLDQLPNFLKFRFSHPDQTTADGEKSSTDSRTSRPRLNPAFVAWLMNWPWWWTNPNQINSAASVMALYRSSLLSHLSRLLGEPGLYEVAA